MVVGLRMGLGWLIGKMSGSCDVKFLSVLFLRALYRRGKPTGGKLLFCCFAVLRILSEFFCFGEVSSILIFTQTTVWTLYLSLMSVYWKRARSWVWNEQGEQN